MDAATIEETNRIRVSLGMKPLPVPGAAIQSDPSSRSKDEEAASTLESRQAESYENYKKHQEAAAAKKKREDRAAAIRKARDEAQRFAVMEGKGLGEEDAKKGDVDAKAWLMGQKKRQKKIDKARKLEAELAAAEAEAAAAVQYTSKDLAGIKVAHDTSDFLGGEDQVLTLKDTTIEENEEEGDELENLGVREQEKLGERLDLKKRRPGYDPNDDEEGQGGILAQYDDEIYGKKGKKFTLDGSGTIAELADILGQPAPKAGKATISLDDIIGDAPMSSDYLAPSEIKVKKPKKKKSKGMRQKQYDDDDIFPLETQQDSNAMDVDTKESNSKKRKAEADTFVDDDDLQASLALQRKSALKKRKKARPEDIAKQLKEEDDEAEQQTNGTGESTGLVIGEISEFVSGLSKRDDEEEKKPRRHKTQTQSPGLPEDHPMENGEHEEQPAIKEESAPPQAPEEETGVEEEKAIGAGMGVALSLLRERGLIEESRDSDYEALRAREEFLARKRILEEELDEQTRQQRERDRASGRLDRMTVREREDWARQQNMWRDQQQSRRMAELFSDTYKPNVELRYTDEHGRSLDQKEAFKHLSHQFHGKGSGKGKTEKRLKKIEDEKRREAQSLFDAGRDGGMSAATAQQLKKRREAGVRLG